MLLMETMKTALDIYYRTQARRIAARSNELDNMEVVKEDCHEKCATRKQIVRT